jgi:membrane protein
VALGITLAPELLAMLTELAAVLQAKLGTRLDQIYPPVADCATSSEEPTA